MYQAYLSYLLIASNVATIIVAVGFYHKLRQCRICNHAPMRIEPNVADVITVSDQFTIPDTIPEHDYEAILEQRLNYSVMKLAKLLRSEQVVEIERSDIRMGSGKVGNLYNLRIRVLKTQQ